MAFDYYKIIGQKIKEARQVLNISQGKLAKTLGKESSTYVALIEAGKRKVSIENLAQIGMILHKPLSYFLGTDLSTKTPEEIIKIGLQLDEELTPSEKLKVIKFYRFIKHDKHNN